MYGGPEFIFGAMLPFPNQKPIPGVMVQMAIDSLGKASKNYELVMKFEDSDTSPEELYASRLFSYKIIEKHVPINIPLIKKSSN